MAHKLVHEQMAEVEQAKEGMLIVSTTALLGEGLEKIDEHTNQAPTAGVAIADETGTPTTNPGQTAQLDLQQGDFVAIQNLTIPASVVEGPSQAAEAEAHNEAPLPSSENQNAGETDQYQIPGQFADEQDLEVDVCLIIYSTHVI